MSIETDLRTYLLTKTAVTNLVGAGVNARIYPSKLKEAAILPAITYQRVSGGHEHMLSGGAGYAEPRIQLDCWSDSYVECKSLVEALRGVLQGFKGTMGTSTVGSVILEEETDSFEPDEVGGDAGTYRTTLDYFVRHLETIPTF